MPAEGDITARGDAQWQAVLACRRANAPINRAGPLAELYGPLCAIGVGEDFAIGHLAQSLDGRIATLSGASHWISGEEDLCHTHRLRALADAVLVGADTILHDDPLLTVRRCTGDNPVRVIIDPNRKLKPHHHVFTDSAAPTFLIVADDCPGGVSLGTAEVLRLPRVDGIIPPATIRRALAARGLHWLFIEGGGVTVSHFLHAGCLDRLQLTIAPVILGSGRASLTLPDIERPGLGLRPTVRRVSLGQDVLFECIFGDPDGK